jgi:HAD superfamily hydrolase (TIGR01509 family)
MKLLIFDFDGLILDTEGPDFYAWQELLADYECPLPVDVWAHCIGAAAGTFDVHRYVEERTGKSIPEEKLRAQHAERFRVRLADEVLRPGVTELLKTAASQQVPCAVGSSATSDWVEDHLERFGIRQHFGTIVCREHVNRAKPAPDIFERVAALADVPIAEAVVFEDSPNGIRAAKRAGAYAVAVPNVVTEQLDLSEADLVLDSLADADLPAIADRMGCAMENTP